MPRCRARHRQWRRPSSSAGACGRQALAVRRPPTATASSAPTPRPAALYGVAVGADYRFSPDTLVGFAHGRRRHRLQRRQRPRHRPLRPVPGRRLHPPPVGTAYLSARAGLWLAGRHHRSHRHRAGIERLRAQLQRQCLLGPPRRRLPHRHAMDAALTPYAAGQFTTFDLPAYAEQRFRRQHLFALNYAAKNVTASRSELGLRTDRSCAMRMRSSRCAAARPGRMTSTPIAISPPRSSRCRAHRSSSTAPHRRMRRR